MIQDYIKEYNSFLKVIEQEEKKFVGRQALLKEYMNLITNNNYKAIILEGEQGCGKTALASKIYNILIKDEKYDVCPIFCSMLFNNANMVNVMNHINRFVSEKLQEEFIEIPDVVQLMEKHRQLMVSYSNKVNKKLVVILEDLEYITNKSFFENNDWYYGFDNELFIIIQAKDTCDLSKKYKTENEVYKAQIPSITVQEKIEIINSICTNYNKQISEETKQKICNLQSSGNILYLETLVHMIIKTEMGERIVDNVTDSLKMLVKAYFDYIKYEYVIKMIYHCADFKISQYDKILKANNYEINDLIWEKIRSYLDIFLTEVDGIIRIKHSLDTLSTYDTDSGNTWFKMAFEYIESLEDSNEFKSRYYASYALLAMQPLKIYEYIKYCYSNGITKNIDETIKYLRRTAEYDDGIVFENVILHDLDVVKDFKFLRECFVPKMIEIFMYERDNRELNILYVTLIKISNDLRKEKSIEDLKKLEFDEYIAINAGKVTSILKRYDESKMLYKYAIDLSNKIYSDEDKRIEHKKIFYYQFAEVLKTSNDKSMYEEMSKMNLNMAIIQYKKSETDETIYELARSLEDRGDSTIDIKCYSNALSYYGKLLKKKEKIEDDIARCLLKLINLQIYVNDFKNALNNCKQLENMLQGKEIDDNEIRRMKLTIIILMYINENVAEEYKQYKEKLEYYKKCHPEKKDELNQELLELGRQVEKSDKSKTERDDKLGSILKRAQEGTLEEKIAALKEYINGLRELDESNNNYKDIEIKKLLAEMLDNLFGLYCSDIPKYALDVVDTLGELGYVRYDLGEVEESNKMFKAAQGVLMKYITFDDETKIKTALKLTRTYGDILYAQKENKEYFILQKYEYNITNEYYQSHKDSQFIQNALMSILIKRYIDYTLDWAKDYGSAEKLIRQAIFLHLENYENTDIFNDTMMYLLNKYLKLGIYTFSLNKPSAIAITVLEELNEKHPEEAINLQMKIVDYLKRIEE